MTRAAPLPPGASVPSADPRAEVRAMLLVMAVALLAWAVTLHGSFVNWDDPWLIVENPHLRGVRHLDTILDPLADRALLGAEYLPVRDLSNLLDYAIFEVEPRGYRLGNWLLHALAAGAAYLFLREALRRRAPALAGALLWAVHPLHAEVVAWASARKDLLNAVFALLAAMLLLRAGRTGERRWWWMALGSFLLATLAKTSAAALPAAVALMDAARGDAARPFRRRLAAALVRAAPLLLVAAAGAALNGWHQSRNWVKADWRGDGPGEHALLVAGVQARYLVQAFWPVHLGPDYAALEDEALRPWNLFGVALVGAAVAATVLLLRRRPFAGALAAWWWIVMIPVANVLVPITNLSADRYLFLPLLGPCALAGLLAARLRFRPVVLALPVAALALLGARQALHWRDGVALWTRAVEVSPRSGRAWMNLGEAHLFAGRDPERAMEAYRRMVKEEPGNATLWVHLGNRLWELEGAHRAEQAEAYLRHAVETADADAGGPLVALAWIVNHRGRVEESLDLLHRAVERQPHLAEARLNLGRWHAAEGRWARAADELEEALRIGLPPRIAMDAHDLLNEVHLAAGDPAAARRHRVERERIRALLGGS